jgi:hypothetical protein
MLEMKNKKNIKKISFSKTDFERILLTDLIPYELPIFFSNDSFYQRVAEGKLKELDAEIQSAFFFYEKYTIPYSYNIIKTQSSTRLLSLMHPTVQLRFPQLYKKYQSLIVSLCNRSSYSIRRPARVATHYFERARGRAAMPTSPDVEVKSDPFDKEPTTASSFFAYADFNMSFRFFDSHRFHDLEKRYKLFRNLDVSKCFYHIYTHTICWATKSKAYAKENVKASTFENDFDALMQHSNYNETNGILVGSEVSRIFAEIIFQKIDQNVERALESEGMTHQKDYVICRYVDDYYVFANDAGILDRVQRSLNTALVEYKLFLNETKTRDLSRPFASEVTRAKIAASKIVDEIFDGLTKEIEDLKAIYVTPPIVKNKEDDQSVAKVRFPKFIRYPNAIASTFIRDLKLLLLDSSSTFDNISSYFNSGLLRRLDRFLSKIDISNLNESAIDKLWRFITQTLTVCMFVFAMSPRVRTTYQLSQIVLLVLSTMEKFPRDLTDQTKKYIFDELVNVIENLRSAGTQSNVEVSNIFVILESLGEDYLLSQSKLLALLEMPLSDQGNTFHLPSGERLDYFKVVTLLSYIKNRLEFSSIRAGIVNYIIGLVAECKSKGYGDFAIKTENVFLIFDLMACPHLEYAERLKIAKAVIEMKHSHDLNARAQALLKTVSTGDWFFRWDGLPDLKAVLMKKELRSAY